MRHAGPRVRSLALVAILLAASSPLPAQSPAPSPAPLRVQQGTARFTARATFGGFTGETAAVDGLVTSPSTVSAATGWVEVRLDSLRTGNDTRDRHMRDALDTDAHPTARFDLDSLVLERAGTGSSDADARPVRLHGRFRVHGVTRPVVATGTLQPRAPAGWSLVAEFPVTLADHDIRKGLVRALGTLRVQPVVQVRVALRFAP